VTSSPSDPYTDGTDSVFNPARFTRTAAANPVLCADNLTILAQLPHACIDLICVDPPFCTQTQRTRTDRHSYDDAWPSLDDYLAFLQPRLEQMRRVLTDTGSLCVHLDYRAVHYVKGALDRLFGCDNFLNEIIWTYRTGGTSKRWFNRKHQTILVYAKDATQHTFHVMREGKHRTDGMNYDEEGRPYKTTKKGRLYFHADGPALTDVWDIPFLSTVGSERIGWPDQKPLKLLERLIRALSNPNDRVADFFAGSGTAVIAAHHLDRRFLACDIRPEAVALIRKRLALSKNDARTLFDAIDSDDHKKETPPQ